MLLNVIERKGSGSGLWDELDRLQNEFSGGFFESVGSSSSYHNPPVNLYVGKDDVLLTALIPGFESSAIELSIIENKVQIKGTCKKLEGLEGYTLHHREIETRDFERVVEIPFRADASKAEAMFKNGILSVRLYKTELDKPIKISVQIEN